MNADNSFATNILNENNFEKIPAEKFEFAYAENFSSAENVFSKKPRGYFADAMLRFVTNRGSVVCFFIIILLVLYAIFAPLFSGYKISDRDGYYAYASPKCALFVPLGFWDGCETIEVNAITLDYLKAIPGAVVKYLGESEHTAAGRKRTWYKIKVDTYAKTGWVRMFLTDQEFKAAREWEKNSGIQLFFPLIDESKVKNAVYKNDQNAWFLTDARGYAKKTAAGELQNIFLKDGDFSALSDSSDGYVFSVSRMNDSQKEVRVLYSAWYLYKHGRNASFLFGADNSGYDIFTRLAYGARLSLLLSVVVAAINLCLGTVVGALEGYYGGAFDIIMERIKDILYEIPSVILMTLFQLYFAKSLGPIVSMFVAFIFFGWIGTSSTVRAQFYRFKGQDYVLASRTLGAGDARLIFRHILPNSIGFIITASVLSIPAVIFSEANLTYLGIVNLQSDTMTSVGTMLNSAQSALSQHPHCVFFPAAFISVLLICFNEFGNGLRDAFNPSLRGAAGE